MLLNVLGGAALVIATGKVRTTQICSTTAPKHVGFVVNVASNKCLLDIRLRIN